MSLLRFFMSHIGWYWSIALVSSIIQGIIGYFYQKNKVILLDANFHKLRCLDKWWTFYIHDIIFNSVCNFVGFVALYVEYRMFSSFDDLSKIGVSGGVILVFLSIVAISGIAGVLPSVLPSISKK